VLGRATPVYHLAYLVLPGLKMFRFPTRFLIVVDLGLAVLGGVGLTRMRGEMERLAPGSALPRAIAIAICAATALDLLYHQPRQNPMVPGSAWLAPPPAVDVVRADTPQPRTFTPRHRDFHRLAFQRARGWSNVEPYFALRDVLEPNVGGGYWSIPSADCYAGISARWSVDVWGDHNRNASIAAMIAAVDANGRVLRTHPVFANVLRTFGVTHVLSPFPLSAPGMALVREDPNAYIYRVAGTARARFVRGARPVSTEREAVGRLMDKAFDPDAEIILHDAPASIGPLAGAASAPPDTPGTGTASVTRDDTTDVVVDVDAPADGFLLLADTYYPGWSASVDGAPVPIYRANLSVRGIQVPKGRHQARFEYELPGLRTGAKVSTAAGAALLLWVAGAAYAARPRGSASVAAV